MSVGYSRKSAFARINHFRNTFEEEIQTMTSPSQPQLRTYSNTGGAEVEGVELEMKSEIKERVVLSFNYAYQWPKSKEKGERLADVPTHRANGAIDISIFDKINSNISLYHTGERPRAIGENRGPVGSYTLVDFTLLANNIYKTLELKGTVHNLLDRRYADPVPLGTVREGLPGDRRSFLVEARYKY